MAALDILVTRRLTLRPPLEVDLDAVAAALDDREISRWLGQVPHPYTLADARDWYENIETGPRDRRWTIHDATGFVGIVSVSRRVRKDVNGAALAGGELELGYWLARSRWGRGLMSEAVRAVLCAHFARGGDTLISGAQIDNAASLAIQAKFGFEASHVVELPSKASGRTVEVQRTRLTRAAFEKLHPTKEAA